MRAQRRPSRSGRPRWWWVAATIGALLVAATVVAAYALGHARGQAVPASPATGVTTTATGMAPSATSAPSATTTALPAPTGGSLAAPPSSPGQASMVPSTPLPRTTPSTKTPPLAATTVSIATAGWLGGAARVSGFATVVEEGGTCTLTLTRGDVTLTGSRAATEDAASTSCGVIEIRDARLTAGVWQAVLTYSSSTSTGSSAPTPLTIG